MPDVDAFCGNILRAVLVEQERGVLTVVNHNIYLLAEGSETISFPSPPNRLTGWCIRTAKCSLPCHAPTDRRDVPFCVAKSPGTLAREFCKSTIFARIVSIGERCVVSHAVNTARTGIELRNASACVASTSARKLKGLRALPQKAGAEDKRALRGVSGLSLRTQRRRNERT
jgi:hypothetical protein